MKKQIAACLLAYGAVASANAFLIPYEAEVTFEAVGGSAGAVTSFGLGTSTADFVAYLNNLPGNVGATANVGTFAAGTNLSFAMRTEFGGVYWAFSSSSDPGSVRAFSDTDNSLGWGGNVYQQVATNQWLLHLDDAASLCCDDDDNDVMIKVTLNPVTAVPEPSTYALMGLGLGAVAYTARRRRKAA